MKLRLITTLHCGRECPRCCNKQLDMQALPVVETFKGFDLIMLTGGEPLLFPQKLRVIVNDIRSQTDSPIIVYGSQIVNMHSLHLVDGLTFTIHSFSDWFTALRVQSLVQVYKPKLSLRLNVFKEARLQDRNFEPFKDWQIKKDIEWIPDFPLPEGEVLMRVEKFWK